MKLEQIIAKYGRHPLTNFELDEAVKDLSIPNCRGCFMRNELPKRPRKTECGILNLDDTNPNDGIGSLSGSGTHWTCWWKSGNNKIYFDSFGLIMPLEMQQYLKKPISYWSEIELQERNSVICGHICLYILKKLTEGNSFLDSVLSLMNE